MKPFKDNAERPDLLEDQEVKIFLGIIGTLLALLVLIGILANKWAGVFLLALIIIMVMITYRFTNTYMNRLNDYILDLSYRIKRGEQEAIIQMPIGILMYNNYDEIQWINPYLQSKLSDSVLGKPMAAAHPLIGEKLKAQHEKEDEKPFIIEWNGKKYDVSIHHDVQTVYLMDVSKYLKIEEDYQTTRPVFGWINLDNYDEIIKGLDDRTVSEFDSMLTTYLSNWARQHNVYYKRMADDRYLLLLQYKELKRLKEEKFNIVENIRQHSTKRNMPLTISIGMAYGDTTFNELDEIAQRNVDLALSRGGDQAVIRELNGKPNFYGGRTNPMEKRTRVRARMISESLQQEMKQSQTTYVMGHVFPDMDAIGAALGIARIAQMLGKTCKVVIDFDKIGHDIKKLIEEIKKYPETYEHLISAKEAEKAITPDDLIVLVDHHKSSMSIAPKLFAKNNRFVVIDHHRLGQEFEVEPLFAYIEPYASSASELVSEFFEHVPVLDVSGLNRIEATAMLGGIIVDTNSFSLRTGSRTFDAASYLQSMGANPALIQRLLKESPENFFKRNEIIARMEKVTPQIVIATGNPDQLYSQVMAAQTADTILTMEDIEAAFVIVPLNEKGELGISARSLGSVNVQRVMEKMGGGGHLTNAGTQIKDMTLDETKAKLIECIQEIN